MIKIKIDKFRKEDLGEIAFVMKEAFNTVDQGWTDESSLSYVEEYFNKSANFVAKLDNKIIGFVVADKHTDHLFVDVMGVLPNYMNQGVARHLWEKLRQFCTENNVMEIKMISDPKSLAYEWYKKLNFKPTGWVEIALELSSK